MRVFSPIFPCPKIISNELKLTQIWQFQHNKANFCTLYAHFLYSCLTKNSCPFAPRPKFWCWHHHWTSNFKILAKVLLGYQIHMSFLVKRAQLVVDRRAVHFDDLYYVSGMTLNRYWEKASYLVMFSALPLLPTTDLLTAGSSKMPDS